MDEGTNATEPADLEPEIPEDAVDTPVTPDPDEEAPRRTSGEGNLM